MARCSDVIGVLLVLAILHASQGATESSQWRFISEPADVLVARGQPVRFDCVLQGPPATRSSSSSSDSPTDVRWIKDGAFLTLEGDTRRRQLANGSLYISSVEHSKARRTDEGLYQCLVAMATAGSVVSRKARLRVAYMSRQFSKEPQDLVLYPQDTAAFYCDIDAAPAPVFRWYKDDVEVTSDDPRYIFHDDARVLELTNVGSHDFGNYRCIASNSQERAASSRSATLQQQTDMSAYLGVVPSFVVKPENKVALEGSTVVFACAANGRDREEQPPIISWLKDGITIDTSTGRISMRGQGSLYVEDVRESDIGTYICRATNDEDSVDTVATLIVEVLPKFVRRPAEVVVGAVHGQVVVECEVHGVPTPSVTWLKNGEVIVPSDYFQLVAGNSLRILGLVREDDGIYQCLVDSEIGSAQAAARLTVATTTDSKMRPVPMGPLTPRAIRHPVGPPSQSHIRDFSPKNLRAVYVSSRFMTVAWGVPDYPADVSSYVVYWKEVGAQRERVLNTSSLEASIQQLKPSTSYDITVVAVSLEGVSPQGAKITVETSAEVNLPTAPRNVLVTSPSPSALEVRWDVPEFTNGAIRHYKIYYYKMGDAEESELTVGGAGSSGGRFTAQLTDLLPFKEYNVRVVVFNANGTGVSSEDVVARTLSDVPSGAPQNVTFEASGATTLLLRWDPPSVDSQNGVITGYKIRYKKQGTKKSDLTLTTDGTEKAHTITELEKGTVYVARIQALNVNGSGPASEWVTAQTLQNDLQENVVPGQPRGLQVRGMEDSALVSWLPPLETDVKIRGYVLTYGIGSPFGFRVVIDEKQTTHTIRDLALATEYVISLSAYNNAGDGQPIYETFITREETIIEQLTMYPPMGLKAVVLSSTTVHLTWSDNTHSGQASDSRMYTVRYWPKLAKDRKYKYINTTDLNLHIEGLKPNTEYEFAVKVTKGRRGSGYSLTVSNTTNEDLPASYPRDLTPIKMERHPTWVTLNWQPPRYPNGQITGYKVLYTADMTKDEDEWAVEDHIRGDQLSVVIDNLSPDTHYYFKIQARNSKGYSPVSPTVIFLTMSADGTRGGETIETPQDYGTANLPGKKGSSYDSRSKGLPHAPVGASGPSSTPEPEKSSREIGIPPLILWVSIACIGGVSAIALVIIAALLCKRRVDHHRPAEYKPAVVVVKQPSMQHHDQPPDLWIHDHMADIKCHDDTAASVCSSSHHSHHSGGRHDSLMDDMATTSTTHSHSDRRKNSFHSQYSKDSGEIYYNRIAASRQARPMMPLEGAMRPREDAAFELTYHARSPSGMMPRISPGGDVSPVNHDPDDFGRITFERRVQRLPSMPITGGRVASVSRSQSGVGPLAKKPPFSLSASTATASPMKSLAFSSRPPPDVTMCKSECEPLQQFSSPDRTMEYSHEELSAEMANLEGLMKDLNALGTAKDYEC